MTDLNAPLTSVSAPPDENQHIAQEHISDPHGTVAMLLMVLLVLLLVALVIAIAQAA